MRPHAGTNTAASLRSRRHVFAQSAASCGRSMVLSCWRSGRYHGARAIHVEEGSAAASASAKQISLMAGSIEGRPEQRQPDRKGFFTEDALARGGWDQVIPPGRNPHAPPRLE